MKGHETDVIYCQDSKDIQQVPDISVNAVVSSWAWENQVDYGPNPENLGRYRGQEFLDRALKHLEALVPKVRLDGNILIELQAAIHDGESSLIEEKFAVAAVERCGLHLVQKLYAIRTNAEPVAPANRLRRGVTSILHLVRDPKLYQVFKDDVRKPSAWAGRDPRAHKYRPDGKDPGDLIWRREDLVRMPDYQILNAAGPEHNFIASPKVQNASELGHPAVMADAVAEFLVAYASPPGGLILDNMAGAGTTLLAAKKLGRRFIGYEINPEFAAIARKRLGLEQSEENTMTEKPWMTPKEVAVYTGLAVTTIYSKTARGEIPVHKGSGLPRYFRAEIDRWLRGESVPQGDQPAQGPARS